MNITIQKCNNYVDNFNCGIAKGLRKKGILAMVSPYNYVGLFLGIIPIWGKIPKETNNIALNSQNPNFIPTKAKVGIYFFN